jgi:PRC-barrel domain
MTESPPAGPPALEEARGWIGHRVDEIGGAEIGQVHGFFADAEDGKPSWLIVRQGRFRGTLVAIPIDNCAGGGGRVWVAHEREAIRSAPVVDPTRPLLREHELTICAHYGIGEGSGRATEVAGRKEGSVTSQPV